MLQPVLNNPWVRAAGVVLAFVLAAALARFLSPVLVPLFFAFLVAYIFDPLVDFFEKGRIGRMTTIIVLALIGLTLLLAVPLYLLPGVIREADDLRQVAEDRSAAGSQAVQWLADRLPLRSLVEALEWAPEGEQKYDALSVLVVEVASRIREGATDFLRDYSAQIVSFGGAAGSGVAGFFSSVGRWLLNGILFIGNLVLFAFVAGYLLRDFDNIVATAKDLVPPRHRERLFKVGAKIDRQLKGFLRGQALVCLFLGVMYAIGLTIAGVPFGLVLGLFGGLASFVPYLGLILTIGPAVILCVVKYALLDWHLLVVLATFGIAQILEGTLITPKVVGKQVGLGPVWVILAVLVFGNALGFLGLLLAVPIAATLKVLILEGIDVYRGSTLFQGETTKS